MATTTEKDRHHSGASWCFHQWNTFMKYSWTTSLHIQLATQWTGDHANQHHEIDARDAGSVPGSGRFPGVGNGGPLWYFCLGNIKDRGAYTTMRLYIGEMTEWLYNTSAPLHLLFEILSKRKLFSPALLLPRGSSNRKGGINAIFSPLFTSFRVIIWFLKSFKRDNGAMCVCVYMILPLWTHEFIHIW